MNRNPNKHESDSPPQINFKRVGEKGSFSKSCNYCSRLSTIRYILTTILFCILIIIVYSSHGEKIIQLAVGKMKNKSIIF